VSNRVTFDVIANSRATGFDATNAKIAEQAALARKAAEDSQRHMHLLSTGLLAVGAAAIPVAGAATAAVAGLGAAAGVAVVGVLGIKEAMQEGTALGLKYRATFEPIVGEFSRLKQIAAQDMFKGINAGVRALQPLFPTLNRDTALLAGQIGEIAGHVGPALASLFTRLNPLFVSLGDSLVKGSAGFQQWAAQSATVGRFVAYAQTTLPQVEATVKSLIVTVSHIAVAGEAFGGTTLAAIRLFSTAINAIPLGALQTIVPLLLGLKVGSTLSASFKTAGYSIDAFAAKLKLGGGVGAEFSGVAGKLGKAVGFLGPVGIAAGVGLGILSAVMGRSKQQAIENTRYVNELTQAIQNNTVAQTTLTLLQQSGAITAARQLGISQNQLKQSITGSLADYKRVSDQLQREQGEYQRLDEIRQRFISGGATENNLTRQQSDRYHQLQQDIPKVADQVSRLRAAYESAQKAAADQARQLGDSALAAQVSSGAIGKVAKQWGLTTDAYYAAKIAADKNTASIQQATIAMQLESDAAGLLDQWLKRLGNQNLSVAQAQTALAQANNATAKSFHDNGAAIKGSTDKAIANQQAIENSVSASQALASAIGKQTGSSRAEIQSLKNSKAALEDTLRSQHRLTPAVQEYINKLFQIPKRLPPTKIDVDKAQAEAKAAAYQRRLHSIPRNVFTQVAANTRQAWKNSRDFEAFLRSLNGRTATTYVDNYIRTHVSTFISGNVGRLSGLRAAGGPVEAGLPYIVGEHGPELFVSKTSGRIIPNPGPAPAGRNWGGGGDTYVTINVHGGDPHAVIRALEQYVGRGGKIRIARGVN
jgi:hypothetical protein